MPIFGFRSYCERREAFLLCELFKVSYSEGIHTVDPVCGCLYSSINRENQRSKTTGGGGVGGSLEWKTVVRFSHSSLPSDAMYSHICYSSVRWKWREQDINNARLRKCHPRHRGTFYMSTQNKWPCFIKCMKLWSLLNRRWLRRVCTYKWQLAGFEIFAMHDQQIVGHRQVTRVNSNSLYIQSQLLTIV